MGNTMAQLKLDPMIKPLPQSIFEEDDDYDDIEFDDGSADGVEIDYTTQS